MDNTDVARKLEEMAQLLAARGANPHRVRAYQRAATTLRRLERPAAALAAAGGTAELEKLAGIGPTLARAILTIVETGRLPMLDRLRDELDPHALLASVPGVGPVTSRRLVDDLGIRSLEELEDAAHDGRLVHLLGLAPKTVSGIIDSLAVRLARVKSTVTDPEVPEPPVDELLEVDREYLERARAGTLCKIAPRRFNPEGIAWLPILRTRRGPRDYTALFSNTARAHQLGRMHDWVILYYSLGAGLGGRQCTVVTETHGDLAGRRVVRGREDECRARYPRAA